MSFLCWFMDGWGVIRHISNIPVWQNLALKDRNGMASQGDFRSSKTLLTNQELRLKQQRQQIVDGLLLGFLRLYPLKPPTEKLWTFRCFTVLIFLNISAFHYCFS